MTRYIVENKVTREYADFAFESCFSGDSEFGSYRIHFYPDIEKAKKFETKKLAEKSLELLTFKNKNYIIEEHAWPDVEEEMNLPFDAGVIWDLLEKYCARNMNPEDHYEWLGNYIIEPQQFVDICIDLGLLHDDSKS